jgi:hypothetical protein
LLRPAEGDGTNGRIGSIPKEDTNRGEEKKGICRQEGDLDFMAVAEVRALQAVERFSEVEEATLRRQAEDAQGSGHRESLPPRCNYLWFSGNSHT